MPLPPSKCTAERKEKTKKKMKRNFLRALLADVLPEPANTAHQSKPKTFFFMNKMPIFFFYFLFLPTIFFGPVSYYAPSGENQKLEQIF
jgi:hypothetical protein